MASPHRGAGGRGGGGRGQQQPGGYRGGRGGGRGGGGPYYGGGGEAGGGQHYGGGGGGPYYGGGGEGGGGQHYGGGPRGRGYYGDGGRRGRGYHDDGGPRGRGEGSYGRGRGGYHGGAEETYGRGRGGGRGGGRERDGGRSGVRGGRGEFSSGSAGPALAVRPAGEAPLSDRYAPMMAALQDEFKALGIRHGGPTFPARPGFGGAGKECVVKANHFFVGLKDKGLHHYDVTITPEATMTSVYRAVISKLLTERKDTDFGGRHPAYDGRKNLFTAGELPFKSKEFEVDLSDDKAPAGSSGTKREKKYKVVIKHATLISLQDLWMLMAGYPADIPAQALQVFDIVLRDIVLTERNDLGYVAVGRSYFSPGIGSMELGYGVTALKGFYQSCRLTQQGLSLNIDTSSTGFVDPLPVVNFVEKVIGGMGRMTRKMHEQVEKALRGIRIEVTHRVNVRKTYRISSLTTQSARDLTFPTSTGALKTVKDYFRETYNLQLRYDYLPCLQVGNDQRPNYLPMEVCKIIPEQRYQKKLESSQVTELIKFTCENPPRRESSIRKTIEDNQYNSTERANEFGIEVDSYPTTVKARVLKAPKLMYHSPTREHFCPEGGQWNMRGKRVLKAANVRIWACVNLCRDLAEHQVNLFCSQLANICRATGLVFDDLPLPIFLATSDCVKDELTKWYEGTRNSLRGEKIDLLVVVLPDTNTNHAYGEVKRICETEIGLISQCFRRKGVIEKQLQYFANVALKINTKAGGTNSVFADTPESLPVVSNKPTIIFGADVTHPGALDDSTPSIAAVVASLDWPGVTKYNSVVRAQGHREELIKDLEGIVKELLIAFGRDSKHRPQQLIFYRDGVSEGQFKQVLEREIPEIEKAWKSLYNEKPHITFIVVQKRHHTRLFPNNYDDTGSMLQNKNVLPGTVVDRKICHPREFDFFLCSHAGIKGTSRPSHYHVLRDDNKFTADGLQTLTNSLCYISTSCTRSVSIPSPVYYAHKLAFRARFYLPQGPDALDDNGAPRALPNIRDEVKRSMFYC